MNSWANAVLYSGMGKVGRKILINFVFPFCQVDANLTLKAEPLMQVNTSQKVVSYPHTERNFPKVLTLPQALKRIVLYISAKHFLAIANQWNVKLSEHISIKNFYFIKKRKLIYQRVNPCAANILGLKD